MKHTILFLTAFTLLMLPACTTIAAEDNGISSEKLYVLQMPAKGNDVLPGNNFVVPAGVSNCGSGDYYYITYFCSCGGSCKKDKEYMCHNNCKCYDSASDMPSECTSYSVGTKE